MHLLIRWTVVLTILMAAQACARGSAPEDKTQDKAMNGQTPTAESGRALQDQAAAIADAAADKASAASPSTPLESDYAPLPQGPAMTADSLVDAILRMAKTLESPRDMNQAYVASVTAVGMLPDSRGERSGIQGSIGQAHYELAAWKRYKQNPGESVELTVRPSESCELSFKSLHDPLVTQGFRVTRSAPGFKPIVYFARDMESGFALHVILSTDSHTDPKCVSRVRLEMEPSDG